MKTKSVTAFATAATLILAAAAANAQSAFTNALMSLNPVAYWPLQETVQPPTAEIETNYGSFGAAGNAYYSSTDAVPGSAGVTGDGDTAINFKGPTSGAFLAVPQTNGLSLPVGPFTVEAWVYPTNGNNGNAYTIVSQTGPYGTGGLNNGPNSGGWSLNQDYIPSHNNNISLMGWSFHVFNGQGASGGAEVIAPNYLTVNTWYHIVGVFDGANAYLYVDGTNAGTTLSQINGAYVQDTWTPLTIGSGRGFNNNEYYGSIDEVAIYTNALTALQVSNHYAQVGTANYSSTIVGDKPYLYWRMDAPSYAAPATTAYPVANSYGTGNNQNGLYLSGDMPGVPGPSSSSYPGMPSPSYACAFNGIGTSATNYIPLWTNGVITSSNVAISGVMITNLDPSMNLNNPVARLTNSITAMCWFKSNPADGRYQGLFGRGDSSWKLSLAATSGQIAWFPGVGSDFDTPSGINYNDGNWHFAVGVYQYAAPFLGTNFVYVDGNLVAQETLTNLVGLPSITNTLLGGAPDYAPSGGSFGYRNRFFSGSLAHCAYFTNALTAAQVVKLYTNATGGVSLSAPVITGQPVTGRTAGAGGTNGVGVGSYIFFGVNALGGPPLSYQWYYNSSSNYNGTPITSDGVKYTNSTWLNMTISNLMTTDSGYYYVIVTNNFGSTTSILATLKVSLAPAVAAQNPAAGFSLYPNQNQMLSLTVNGATPFSYQWYTNGVADTTAGAAATYTASGSQAVSGETYQCIVANIYGTATSAVQTVTLVQLPASILNSSYATNVLALGATGYWPMHEKEAQPFAGDIETNYGSWGAIGNGYYEDWASPTNIHNSAGAIAGNSDPAVTFFNAENAVVVPHWTPQLTIGVTNNPAFTLEAWVKPFISGNTQGGTYMSIMGQGAGNALDNSANHAGFVLQYGGTADTFSLVVQNGVGSADYEQKTVANFPPGQWYHIVCLWSGSNVVYYVNGSQAGFLAGNPTATDNPNVLNPDICSPFTIGGGRWGTGGGGAHPWEGEIDEVAVYTNLLTQQQIANDYAAGTTVGSNYFQAILGNGPVMYYHMDAPNYTPPAYGQLPVLTNYGSVPLNGVYVASAIPGSAMGPNANGEISTTFSGTNAMAGNGVMSFADAGFSPLWDPTNITSFSYSAWVRGRPCDDRSYNEMFCANDSTWRAVLNSSGNFQVHGNADIIPTNIVNDGNWHQWVITSYGYVSNGLESFTNNVYIDGLLAKQQWAQGSNNPANSAGPEVTIGTEWGNTNPVTQGNGGRQFDGDICEAAFFYGTVLTSNQVQTLYNAGGMAPTITAQPSPGTAVDTLPFTNGIAAMGAQPLYYQWYTNGVAVGGSAAGFTGQVTNNVNVDVLTINPVQFANAGNYYVIITNAYGSATSSVVNIAVVGAPVITNQLPVPYTNEFTVYAGANPTFTVQYLGAPSAYYWFSNGVAIAGASGSSFTYTNVQATFTNIGCIVSNFLGTATSGVWSASVIADPPNSSSGLAPYPQSVLALHPIGYWRMNDTNIDGVDNIDNSGTGLGGGDYGWMCHDYVGGNDGLYTNLTLGWAGYNPAADPSDSSAQFGEADYIGGDFGDSLAFGIAGINFGSPTGTSKAFTIEAWVNGYQPTTSGAGIVTLGWGNGGEQFDLDQGGTADGFRFFMRDASGATHSASTGVAPTGFGRWYHLVGVVDEITNQTISLYVNGILASSGTVATNSGVLSATNLMTIGARASSLANAQANHYDFQFLGDINDVAIYNYAFSATQVGNQYFSTGVAPSFATAPPGSFTVSNGVLNISVLADGTGPLGYYWTDQNAGTNVSAAATNGFLLNGSLVVSNVPAGWNGDNLQLTVTNAYGSTNVSVALTVITGLNVSLGPTNAALYVGRNITYAANASGNVPFYYQWATNGIVVNGATNPSYTATASLGTELITCTVTNSYNGYSLTNAGPAFLTGIATPTNSYSMTVLSANPIAFWPLNEGPDNLTGDDGTIAHDYVAGNNGLYTNVVLNNAGYNTNADPSDTSTLFDSVAQVDSVVFAIPGPDFATPNGSNAEFSVEAWAMSTYNNGLNTPTIAAKGNYYAEEYNLDAGASDSYRFSIREANGTEVDAKSSVSISNTNQWYHLVGTCDESNGVITLYIDGQAVATGSPAVASGITNSSWIPMTIGSRATGVGLANTQEWPGYISDVAVYNYVLTPAQVLAHYQAGLSTGGAGVSFTNAPPITFSVLNKSSLVLSWPAKYAGYYFLESQTNTLAVGLSSNWVPVGGSAGASLNLNQWTVPVVSSNGAVFYRLMTNAP